MIDKASRLSRERFTEVFKRGARREAELFRVIRSPIPLDAYCASAVVSKKVAPKAVVRNRLRRRVYHALSRIAQSSTLTGSIIVIAKPALVRAAYRVIESELARLVAVGRPPLSR